MALVLAPDSAAARRVCGWLTDAHCDAMVCCDPVLALDWVLEHDRFFTCVIIEPGLAEAPGVAGLIAAIDASGGTPPILVRTPFPSPVAPERAVGSTVIPLPRRIPAGEGASRAALRALLSDAAAGPVANRDAEGGP